MYEEQSKWDAARFLATLNYFGEVPFLGSFRWIQQWLGQSPVVSGMAFAMQKKVVVMGAEESALFGLLRSHLAPALTPAMDVLFYPLPDSLSADSLPVDALLADTLKGLVQSSDASIVLNIANYPDLPLYLANGYDKVSDCVEQSVFDFSKADFSKADFLKADSDVSVWGALDDVVMGGVSQGRLFQQAQQAVFAGNVSTNNSGGFSSVRTRNFDPPYDFSHWRGLRLRVKGDGQRYKFILRNSGGWDSPAYIYGFDTRENVWMDVNVPFDQLVPTFRARSVPDAPAFDAAKVFSFQLMLSKFEKDRQLNPQFTAGPFELAVSKISVYRARRGVPLVVVGSQAETLLARQQWDEAQVPYRWIDTSVVDGGAPDEGADWVSAILLEGFAIAQSLT
jgi:Complex I intermediate-associated protein 30 (CIA30)